MTMESNTETPESLLEQYRHFNNEIRSLQIFMDNCTAELKSLTELDAEKLTEEQRGGYIRLYIKT
jgi:hypothetical protein